VIEKLGVQPNDRVLFLSIPDLDTVETIADILESGGAVFLGALDEVYEMRRHASNRRNVLFHPGPPEEIPFDGEYFTLVVDLKCDWEAPAVVAREVARVLQPGGRAVMTAESAAPLLAAGLATSDPVPPLLSFTRPKKTPPKSQPRRLQIFR
jgi:SAM-dependent methyltransferase